MKNFYTVDELKKLTSKELQEITTFKGDNTDYYYSKIVKILRDKDEYCIIFSDNEEIYTKNHNLIEKIKNGKTRFDLITKSLEHYNNEQQEHTAFYEAVQKDITNQMQEVHNQINIQKNNFELMTKSIQQKTNDDIAKLGNTVAKTLNKWNKRIDSLNSVDTKKFEKMMKQMEIITEAFGSLLEN